MGGQMKDLDDDWDELAINKNRRRLKKSKFKNSEHQKDAEFSRHEERKFIETLESKSGKYSWMKEKRYKTMFRNIEDKIQGAMGKGPFEWVDRRVFDQVFDRLTLMSLYKLMKNGVIDTLDFPVARGKEAHVFNGSDIDGNPVAVKIFHTSNAVFKNIITDI